MFWSQPITIMGPHQHPHSHPHHEPSRQFQRPVSSVLSYSAPRQSGLDVVNPRILDASIHDVTERLSNEQKAEVLIHAMNLLKLAKYVLLSCLFSFFSRALFLFFVFLYASCLAHKQALARFHTISSKTASWAAYNQLS